jgi:membrane protein required for colicin V production
MSAGSFAVNVVDPILLVIFFLFGLRGYFKGLFREIFSLAGLILGLMMAIRFDEPLAVLAEAYWKTSPLLLKGVAFVAIFFVVYFLFNVIGWLLHRSEKLLFLQAINRMGGIAVGVGKGAALTGLIIFVLLSISWFPAPVKDQVQNSYLVAPLSQLAEGIIRLGKDKLFSNRTDTYLRLGW